MGRILAARAQSKGRMMAKFKFCLTGSPQMPIVEVDATDLHHLHQLMDRSRFVEGRMVEVDGEGATAGVLIPVSRIQFILEVDDH